MIINVSTTIDTNQDAEKMANLILENRLGACVQITPIQSFYTWQGKIVNEAEFQLSIKTLDSAYDSLEKLILSHHTYTTPQIIATPVTQINQEYKRWILDSVSC